MGRTESAHFIWCWDTILPRWSWSRSPWFLSLSCPSGNFKSCWWLRNTIKKYRTIIKLSTVWLYYFFCWKLIIIISIVAIAINVTCHELLEVLCRLHGPAVVWGEPELRKALSARAPRTGVDESWKSIVKVIDHDTNLTSFTQYYSPFHLVHLFHADSQ